MKTLAIAAAVLAASSTLALAQTTGQTTGQATGQTAGSGGSAAAGDTAASTLGMGAQSGDSRAMGMGATGVSGSGGHVMDHAKVTGGGRNGQAMAQAHDKGTFSKSHTHCKNGSDVDCRTKSMSHLPGQKPVMSTNESSSAGTAPQ